MDTLIRAISDDGYVSCVTISSRELTERARNIHSSSRTATAAFGRTMAATVMLSSSLKSDSASITTRISGGGAIGTIVVVAEPDGESGFTVRCCASNPTADTPRRVDGKLDVGALVGTDGMLTVIRDDGTGEPYVGSVELVSGEIGDDFTQYLVTSEQRPSAVGLGVLIGVDGTVAAAGGYIVSLMPDAPDEYIDALERNVAAVGAVTSRLTENPDPWELARLVLDGFEPRILSRSETQYRCNCSRERVLGAIAAIGEADAREIIDEGKPIEVTCRFCDAQYVFTPQELEENLR
ncbi:MAG: Hsp33 family molecular chaperone HslO [Oscillospiraceae bacterium]|jgi:molecular chaperone Hsp33|nr:Hsp33 family molecular chaperone HslO [Oscillospiraceae bacterium]